MTRDFQNRLLDRTLKGFNSWDARFVQDEMLNRALADTCVILNSSVGTDNKALTVHQLQAAITAAWASLTHEEWRDSFGEHTHRKQLCPPRPPCHPTRPGLSLRLLHPQPHLPPGLDARHPPAG